MAAVFICFRKASLHSPVSDRPELSAPSSEYVLINSQDIFIEDLFYLFRAEA